MLLGLPFIIILGFFLFFLPFKFTLDSIFNLVMVPSQIYNIATNPILRKNHGLEHATANILEREYGYKNISGYAVDDGFYIIGVPNTMLVEQAARKGLYLMKKGYSDLAIHKSCGTSLTASSFVSAVVFLGLLLSSGYFSIINMVIAILFANIIGPYLGKYLQRYFTTSAEVNEMEVVTSGFAVNKRWNSPPRVFVKTRNIPFVNRICS
ncbi:MAG: DUF6391 domain-containing protein [Halanaerobiales bacterium]